MRPIVDHHITSPDQSYCGPSAWRTHQKTQPRLCPGNVTPFSHSSHGPDNRNNIQWVYIVIIYNIYVTNPAITCKKNGSTVSIRNCFTGTLVRSSFKMPESSLSKSRRSFRMSTATSLASSKLFRVLMMLALAPDDRRSFRKTCRPTDTVLSGVRISWEI